MIAVLQMHTCDSCFVDNIIRCKSWESSYIVTPRLGTITTIEASPSNKNQEGCEQTCSGVPVSVVAMGSLVLRSARNELLQLLGS